MSRLGIKEVVFVTTNLVCRDKVIKVLQYGSRLLLGYYQHVFRPEFINTLRSLVITLSNGRKAFRLGHVINCVRHLTTKVHELQKLRGLFSGVAGPSAPSNVNDVLVKYLETLEALFWCVFFHFDSVIFGVRVGILPDKNQHLYESISFGNWFAADVTSFAKNAIRLADNIFSRRRISSLQTNLSENIRRAVSNTEGATTSTSSSDSVPASQLLPQLPQVIVPQQVIVASVCRTSYSVKQRHNGNHHDPHPPLSSSEHKVCVSDDGRVSRSSSSVNLDSRSPVFHVSSSSSRSSSGTFNASDVVDGYPANVVGELQGNNPMRQLAEQTMETMGGSSSDVCGLHRAQLDYMVQLIHLEDEGKDILWNLGKNAVDMVVSGSFNKTLPINRIVGEGFVGVCGVISAVMAIANELSRCGTIEEKHKQVVMQLRGVEVRLPNDDAACLVEAERRTNPCSSGGTGPGRGPGPGLLSEIEEETKDPGAEPVGMSA